MRTTYSHILTIVLVALVCILAACSGPPPETSATPSSSPLTPSQPTPSVPRETIAAPPAETSAPAAPKPETPPPAPGEQPVDGDWLVTRLSAEMPHLNPLTHTDAYAYYVYLWIYDTLIEYDNETIEPIPAVAESWDISPDHLIYTFHLRKDVKFTDGVPLTAKDVKFTFDKMMDPATDCAHVRNMYQDVDHVEIPDDYTVRFVCKKPYFRNLIVFGLLRIMPEHIFSTGDFNNHPNNRKPIGSGPYVFDSWETGRQVVLVRNENYWGKKPPILRRVYKIITDDNAAFQVLESGDIDAMEDIPREAFVTRMAKPEFEAKFNKFKFYSPRYTYIGWNSEKPWFKDKRVRQAMTMLLDRQTMVDKILNGLARVVSNEQFIDSPEYNHNLAPWPFDPVAAKALLDEAGWKDSNGDGTRDKDGVPFKFELLYAVGRAETERILTVYQEELVRAGIQMVLRPLEWAAFLENATKGKFDAYTAGWTLPLYPDPYSTWHSSQTAEGGYNRVGFRNAEADKLIEDARVEFDRDKRIKLYHRLAEILHDEQPYTFLHCPAELLAVDKRFHGIKIYPYGPDSREWWVPANLQKYK